MKLSFAALFLPLLSVQSAPCPFSKTNNELPQDNTHSHLRRGRRLESLGKGELKNKLSDLIQRRKLQYGITTTTEDEKNTSRGLFQTECMTQATYDDISDDIAQMAADIQAAEGDGELGHFVGGIVRLAAHDFMDFDRNAAGTTDDEFGGSDGCLDFAHAANAGLPDLWCDDPATCPLKFLYDTIYSSSISKADFWVVAANAAIAETAVGTLNLPFRFGRVDSDNCPNSSIRLPEPGGCSDVEATFIDRMGVSWTDATALMGAHTLGRGDANFSGHPGTWVQNDQESTIFDNNFYRETINRGWRPRFNSDPAVGTDWTWGGPNRGVMMLNTDICLRFDIPDGDEQTCCTNQSNPNHCRDETLPECPSSESVRPEAFAAMEAFNSGGNNNAPFYEAFTTAWLKATENGYDSLQDLVSSCGPTDPPTNAPTSPQTASPTNAPTSPQTASPTNAPTAPQGSPTNTPTSSPTASDCSDHEGTFPVRKQGYTTYKDCAWVINKDKCSKFGEEFCPLSCELC